MLRRLALIFVCVWLPVSALALDPDTRLSQYAHSVWRVQDGALSAPASAIAQTTDGYVWIATSAGLVRFDGVRFETWTPGEGQEPLLSNTVYSLLGARDGSLWIGTASHLAHLKDGRLVHYTDTRGRFNEIAEDSHGGVWATRTRITDGGGPLCQATETRLRCYGKADGIALPLAVPMIIAPDGTFWFGGSGGLARWKDGASTILQPRGLQHVAGLSGVNALAVAADGALWIGMTRSGPGLGLQQLQDDVWKPIAVPGFDGTTLLVNALYLDRAKAMWIGTEGQGIYRWANDRMDRFVRADGLSGDSVTDFYEDREGNMWVATTEGVDCFRSTRMISYSVREGLGANSVGSVFAGRDGAVWVGNNGTLDVIRGDRVSSISPKEGLPGISVTALLEDRAGRLWLGVDNGLFVYEQGRFRPITRPDGAPFGATISLTEDRTGNIWAVALGPPRRLVRIEDFKIREDIASPQIPQMATIAADPADGVWLGLTDSELGRYRQGRVETFQFFRKGQGAVVRQVGMTPDGAVLGATTGGLIGWREGTRRTLTPQNGLPCGPVHAFVFDAQDALWLYTQCGLVTIAAQELRRWWERADAAIEMKVFDAFDGVRPALAPFQPRASRAPDGRLWFVNETVVQMIDPARHTANTILPPVHIEQIIADRKRYAQVDQAGQADQPDQPDQPNRAVHLPPLTGDLQIDYVALSFVAPQKVRFRYRLEGRDQAWQEPGTRRQAFYNDLRPGTYRFRVIAANNDGLWNEHGASLDIVIAPAWYQTNAFVVMCIVIGVLAIWALYQLRMRQLARALNARFDERLAERTRMARDLHDTLLQTVQGSKMVVDNALNQPDGDGMRRAMEQVSVWLGQASTEGRAAVNELRVSTIEKNDLAGAFRRAIEDCGRRGSQEASLSVTGTAKEMHPVVRDEVYRIGYEAIRNACTHSGGTRLEIALTYARDLTLRVSDNGVGIDPSVASGGREGHFGLQGMRERAKRIGATLTIDTVDRSGRGAGTAITLIVPGRVVFHEQRANLFARLRARLTS